MKYPSEEDLLKTFGRRIKGLRKEQELSQSELAAMCNIEKSAIQRIERGYNSTLKTILKLANGFDITLSELLNFDKNE